MEVDLTRPKSAKGRRREVTHVNHPGSFTPRTNSGSTSLSGPETGGPRSQPHRLYSKRVSQDQIQLEELLNREPPPGQSLSRFKVLPSIVRGGPRTGHHSRETETTRLASTGQPISKGKEATELGSNVCSSMHEEKVALPPATLLLAIKDPGGRRFQEHFNSTDTLLRVRASAEAQFGAHYGVNASIETMEVPRRSFTDMSQTLSQCGITNKSVLCIYQPQD